jgi:hypothetical protein
MPKRERERKKSSSQIKKLKKLNRKITKMGMNRHSIPVVCKQCITHSANPSSHCSVFLSDTTPSPTHAKERVSGKRSVS